MTLHLGWLTSGLLFVVLIAIPGLLRARAGLNSILAFWCAYVLTRPLGASFADWVALPHDRGGLGAGTGAVTLGMTAVIVLLVVFLALRSTGDRPNPSVHDMPSAQ